MASASLEKPNKVIAAFWSRSRLLFWAGDKNGNVVEPAPTFVLG